MKYLIPLILAFNAFAFKKFIIDLNIPKIERASSQIFKRRDKALAVNISYPEIRLAKSLIEKKLDIQLKSFKGWNAFGEAHITVITPPEMDILNKYVKESEINNIARNNKIQSSDIKLLAIGSGKNDESETFFIIVKSENLLKIRQKISDLYVKRSKKVAKFNPNWFFPHITIGFTKKDLHEHNGIIKNMAKSYDKRFLLK